MKYERLVENLCHGDYKRCLDKGEVKTYNDNGPITIKVDDAEEYCRQKVVECMENLPRRFGK